MSATKDNQDLLSLHNALTTSKKRKSQIHALEVP